MSGCLSKPGGDPGVVRIGRRARNKTDHAPTASCDSDLRLRTLTARQAPRDGLGRFDPDDQLVIARDHPSTSMSCEPNNPSPPRYRRPRQGFLPIAVLEKLQP
jgi:hypothetical protein